eukprot:scaffold155_cov106-Isochrysis_galbana.AAC.2
MIVPWGAVGPTMAVGVYKPPHAPERGMGRPPHCARFRDGELNPTSFKEVGLSCGGSNNHLSTMS